MELKDRQPISEINKEEKVTAKENFAEKLRQEEEKQMWVKKIEEQEEFDIKFLNTVPINYKKDYLERMIEEGSSEEIVKNLKKIKNADQNEIAEMLISNDDSCIFATNFSKFSDLKLDSILNLLKKYPDELYNDSNELFEQKKFIKLIDKTDAIKDLIEIEPWDEVISYNLEKFKSADHNVIARKFIEKDKIGILLDDLHNFSHLKNTIFLEILDKAEDEEGLPSSDNWNVFDNLNEIKTKEVLKKLISISEWNYFDWDEYLDLDLETILEIFSKGDLYPYQIAQLSGVTSLPTITKTILNDLADENCASGGYKEDCKKEVQDLCFKGRNTSDTAEQLLENDMTHYLVNNLKDFEELNEKIALALIDQGYDSVILNNSSMFGNIFSEDFLNKLIEGGNAKYIAAIISNKPHLANEILAKKLLEHGDIEILIDNIELFGKLSQNIAEIIIFTGKIDAVAHSLGVFTYLNQKIAEKLCNAGYYDLVIKHQQSFDNLDLESLKNYILTQETDEKLGKLDGFSDLEKTEVKKIIEAYSKGITLLLDSINSSHDDPSPLLAIESLDDIFENTSVSAQSDYKKYIFNLLVKNVETIGDDFIKKDRINYLFSEKYDEYLQDSQKKRFSEQIKLIDLQIKDKDDDFIPPINQPKKIVQILNTNHKKDIYDNLAKEIWHEGSQEISYNLQNLYDEFKREMDFYDLIKNIICTADKTHNKNKAFCLSKDKTTVHNNMSRYYVLASNYYFDQVEKIITGFSNDKQQTIKSLLDNLAKERLNQNIIQRKYINNTEYYFSKTTKSDKFPYTNIIESKKKQSLKEFKVKTFATYISNLIEESTNKGKEAIDTIKELPGFLEITNEVKEYLQPALNELVEYFIEKKYVPINEKNDFLKKLNSYCDENIVLVQGDTWHNLHRKFGEELNSSGFYLLKTDTILVEYGKFVKLYKDDNDNFDYNRNKMNSLDIVGAIIHELIHKYTFSKNIINIEKKWSYSKRFGLELEATQFLNEGITEDLANEIMNRVIKKDEKGDGIYEDSNYYTSQDYSPNRYDKYSEEEIDEWDDEDSIDEYNAWLTENVYSGEKPYSYREFVDIVRKFDKDVKESFRAAMFKGNILKVARMIENKYGPSSFRILSNMNYENVKDVEQYFFSRKNISEEEENRLAKKILKYGQEYQKYKIHKGLIQKIQEEK